MQVTSGSNGHLELEEVYNEITLKTDDGEELTICMRDSGFEFTYGGEKYSAKGGKLRLCAKDVETVFGKMKSKITAVI